MNNTIIPSISIITITKDDEIGLQRTGSSILAQNIEENIEWIVIDGSNHNFSYSNNNYISKFNKLVISTEKNILIKYKNIQKTNIKGIYPSLNYARELINGKASIYLNGGDEFYNNNSLKTLYESFVNQPYSKVICFGQAEINSKIGLKWNFPGKNISNIENWLKYLEPNHQSMLVSSVLALNNEYQSSCTVEADKYWKRAVILESESTIFIRKVVCKFYLGGASSKKPSIKLTKSQLLDKRHSYIRKLITLIKFLIPKSIYKYYPYLQKIKNDFTNLIF